MAQDVQKQASIYYELIHKGYPPEQAFREAFPNGVPTAQDRAKEQAKNNQNQAYGQTAGTLVGALGTAYLLKKIPELLDSKVVATNSTQATNSGGATETIARAPVVQTQVAAPAATTSAPAAATGPAAPTGVSATRSDVTVTGPAENGGTMMSNGSTVMPDGSVIAKDGTKIGADGTVQSTDGTGITGAKAAEYLGYAAAAYNAYDTYRNRGNMTGQQEAAGYASAGVQAGQAYTGGNGYLSAAGAGLGAYGAYQNDSESDMQKATHAQQQAALAFTGVAAPFLYAGERYARKNKHTRKILERVDKLDMATNPATRIINAAMGGGGKDQDQTIRDNIRSSLIKLGIADDDYNVALADGSKFNIGKDGGSQELKNVGTNLDDSDVRHSYDVDHSNPLAVANIAKVSGLVDEMLGDKASRKAKSDLVGLLMNPLTSNAKSQEEFDMNFQAVKNRALATVEQKQKPQAPMPDRNVAPAPMPAQQQMPARNNGPAPVSPMTAALGANNQTQLPPRNTAPAPVIDTSAYVQQPGRGGLTPEQMQQGYYQGVSGMPARNTMPAPVPSPMAAALSKRSKTRSPGIDENGRRISY